jgi:hypothetical protein
VKVRVWRYLVAGKHREEFERCVRLPFAHGRLL